MHAQKNPQIYELNTATFLSELSERFNQSITLNSVPADVWDEIAALRIDTVWLMGVWKRSEFARDMARLQPWIHDALPDATDSDVLGSAYSIADYHVDEQFGGDDGLAVARTQLANRGIKLILDFVPNHVAVDHWWTRDHPDYFLSGTDRELASMPSDFVAVGDHIFANGKDPHFVPWSDVLQLNVFSEAVRLEIVQTLERISTICDGVRCDMAMLLINEVFAKTWGHRAGKRPHQEFWPTIIQPVKAQRPDFLFIAEVYWDKEQQLINEGFDYCYDKKLYDHLVEGNSTDVHRHISHTARYGDHLLHFIENHDEDRAAQTMPWDRHRAAAVIMATLPGASLYHDGQFEGYRRRVPVQLGRRYKEPLAQSVEEFYRGLLDVINEHNLLAGDWKLLKTHAGFLQPSEVLSWSITAEKAIFIILVNFGRSTHNVVVDSLFEGGPPQTLFGTMRWRQSGNKIEARAEPWSYVLLKLATS